MPSSWIHTPSDEALAEMRAWAQPGKDLYAVLRHHLLVVTQRGALAKNGPPSEQMDWPVGATFTFTEKLATVTKFTYGLQESVTSAVTRKLSQEVMSKIGWSAGASSVKVEAAVKSELSAKLGAELVEALQSGLSTNSTYEIEVSTEKVKSLEYKVEPNASIKPIFIYPKLHEVSWKVYLYQTDFLQLEYKKHRFRSDLRKTILQGSVLFRIPLFSINFFEPESELSFSFDQYIPEVADGAAVSTSPLEGKCPPAQLSNLTPLTQLARLAFPTSREEKELVRHRLEGAGRSARPAEGRRALPARRGRPLPAKRRRAARGAAASKPAAKRPATRKPAAKRAGARKPGAKRAPAKRPAAKKAAARAGRA
jgi:hypothetical protein